MVSRLRTPPEGAQDARALLAIALEDSSAPGNIQINCTDKLYICYRRLMRRTSQTSESPQLAALAGELRGVIGKLIRRVREQTDAGDFTHSQKSVILRLERDGPATVSMLARAEGVRPQSMRTTVAALEAAGVVKRMASTNDEEQLETARPDPVRIDTPVAAR
jgi:DNA-binding transcriptional ArsR family regulator